MNSRSTPPTSNSAVEDFILDEDAPRTFAAANDSEQDTNPYWIWAMVRVDHEPVRQVWVRYVAEHAPADALRIRAAQAPVPGSAGVRVVEDVVPRTAPLRRPGTAVRKTAEIPANASMLTTAAAAAYCGFKSTGAIRKALLEGRLKPAGRRGGTGTWMWSIRELDRFLCGATSGSDPVGDANESEHEEADEHQGRQLDEALEELGQADEDPKRVAAQEWRPPGARAHHRPYDGTHQRDQESDVERRRGNGVQVAARRTRARSGRSPEGPATERALRRLRGEFVREEVVTGRKYQK
ncbi:MAG TPA: hypothetical protein VF331_13845 [Polyangiales bacterium]